MMMMMVDVLVAYGRLQEL